MLREEPLRTQSVVLLHRSYHVGAGHLIPRKRLRHRIPPRTGVSGIPMVDGRLVLLKGETSGAGARGRAEPRGSALGIALTLVAALDIVGSIRPDPRHSPVHSQHPPRRSGRRRTGGGDSGWHLKPAAGAAARSEVRLPPGACHRGESPARSRASCRRWCGPGPTGAPLQPVARITIERTVRRLTDATGQVL
jgi:hypothetical protein